MQRPRWFGLDHARPGSPARLAAWVASTDAIARAASPELGDVETMRREHHTWRMTVKHDGSLPPSGLLLHRLRIRHPAPAQVVALFARIGLASHPSVIVSGGDDCGLVAEIQTPFGLRELGAP